MMSINIISILYKILLVTIPFIISVITFLLLLNVSIWIFDDSKVKGAIEKSKKVFKISFIILLSVSLVILIFELLNNS